MADIYFVINEQLLGWCESSTDKKVVKLAEKVIRETDAYLKAAKKRITISEFIPS